MAAGFQTWDSSGTLQLDTSSFIGRFLAVITIPGTTNGSTTVTGLSGGIGFVIPIPISYGGNGAHPATTPQCSFSGDTLTWYRPPLPGGGAPASIQVLVGIR